MNNKLKTTIGHASEPTIAAMNAFQSMHVSHRLAFREHVISPRRRAASVRTGKGGPSAARRPVWLCRLVEPHLGDLLAADVGLFLQHMIDGPNVDDVGRCDLVLILAAP